MPNFIPIVGQLDDVLVVTLAIKFLGDVFLKVFLTNVRMTYVQPKDQGSGGHGNLRCSASEP